MDRPWPKAVLFDLDGTLVDSAPDIRESLNEALDEIGIGPFNLSDVRRMIGGGVERLIERALDHRDVDRSGAEKQRLVARFVSLYEPRSTRLTTLLPFAREALSACRQHGARIALVTNKPAAPAKAILNHFSLSGAFDLVVGGDAGPPMKPAPDLLLFAAKHLGVSLQSSLFVGDSENDVNAAKAAGMPVIVLEGGYTAIDAKALGADIVVGSLRELPSQFAHHTQT